MSGERIGRRRRDRLHRWRQVERERVGAVTAVNTPEGLALGLRKLVGDRQEMGRMKARARARALETYNWSKEKEQLVALVQRLDSAVKSNGTPS